MSNNPCCLLLNTSNNKHFLTNNSSLLNKKVKSENYNVNIAFLMAFSLLVDFGDNILNASQGNRGVKNIEIDINKKEVYKAEKKIRAIYSKIEPFKKQVTTQIKARTSKIVTELTLLTSSEQYISAEILASYLLFNYFCDTEHRFRIDKEFEYFQNGNIYYPILDRVEKTNLVNIRNINKAVDTVIKKYKHR